MKKFTKKQWIKFSIAAVLYTLFAIWMQNLWLLLGLIVLVDIFLTHYIPWGAWKRSKNPAVRNVFCTNGRRSECSEREGRNLIC